MMMMMMMMMACSYIRTFITGNTYDDLDCRILYGVRKY